MPLRRKAADFFSAESSIEKPESTEPSMEDSAPSVGGRTRELRRSARLHSLPAVEASTQPKPQRKSVVELGQDAKKVAARAVESTAPGPAKSTSGKSGDSQDTDEVFEDAREDQFATPSMKARVEVLATTKSPATDEAYMSALEDIDDTTIREEEQQEIPSTGSYEDDILKDIQHPTTTQNTLDEIPSSQPRPRSERSPVPLLPVSSSPPPASLLSTTTFTDVKSTQDTLRLAEPEFADDEAAASNESDSDDEAPQAILLSKSRSEAIESQSKVSQVAKAKADKAREKRRHRDALLASQKQSKRAKTQHEAEISNSQQSVTDINSGNTTDTPAPNQAHQAARRARQAEALPTEILQAASATWLQPDIPIDNRVVKGPKKRKERDDGISILEEMNVSLAPSAGKIGVRKEKMIMRMGRGERRMFIGRFAR